MKRKTWKHKKFRPTKSWLGSYEKLNGERVFILRLQGKLPSDITNIERVYDSPQAAKRDGWYY